MSKSIVPFIKSQFPNYLVESNSLFPDFLEAYYEWVNQISYQKVTYDLDLVTQIDKGFELFANEFIAEYLENIPANLLADKTLLIKKISELYKAKGSPKAVKFLLKIIANVDSEIFYPSTQIFKPSAARWNKDVSVRFTIASGMLTSFENVPCEIITPERTYSLDIRKIERVKNTTNEFEAFLVINYKLLIPNGGTIVTDTFTGNLIRTITDKEILTQGSRFFVGDIFDVVSSDGNGTVIKVKKTTETSGLVAFDIVKFGTGYNSDFITNIFPNVFGVTQNQLNFNIQLIDEFSTVIQSASFSTDDNITSIQEGVLITKFDYVDDLTYMEDNTYVGEVLSQTSETTIVTEAGEDFSARVLFKLGYVLEYPGYYSNNIGFSSDASYIQDGEYYQQFSYVVKSALQYDVYEDVVKRLVHPAGTRLFGEYVITNNLDILVEVIVKLSLNEISFNEALNAIDSFSIIVMKSVVEEVTASDFIEVAFFRELSDVINIMDTLVKTYTKTFSDQTSTNDLYNISINKELQENVNLFEVVLKDINTSTSDSVQSQDAGGLFAGDSYYELSEIEIYGAEYWQVGYAHGETEFVN